MGTDKVLPHPRLDLTDMVLRCTFCTAPTCNRPTLSAPYLGEPKRPSGRETKMLHIKCAGSPYEIGLKHGREAKQQVAGTIAFYANMFKETSHMSWPKVQELAMSFEPVMRRKWPAYLEEIQG